MSGPVDIAFSGSGSFEADTSGHPVVKYSGQDSVDVDGFGATTVKWSIDAQFTESGLDFLDGSFEWTFPQHKLAGRYTDFALNPQTGDYTLDWSFTSGGSGTGQTKGLVDLSTLKAQFEFAGSVTLDD